jgi:hypothetical protein
MQHLVADYTEIWLPQRSAPLIQFAQAHSLLSTGIDQIELSKDLRERLQSFDSIVSWYGSNREEFRAAMLAINSRCVFHWALPRDFSLHATDFYAQQVGAPSGLIPHIRVNQTGTRDSVVIHPFSGSKRKNWRLECFRELAPDLEGPVDWLAGPEEELPDAHRFDNLAHVAAFIAGARLYIGNDSGITHLAAAVGVRTIAIFGPESPRIWVPRGENVEVIAVSDLANLKPSYVARVANRLLDSRPF